MTAPIVVWVVDDDPDVGVHLEIVLRRAIDDVVVQVLVDAAALAGAMAGTGPDPDLVLVDQVLPDASGSDLVRTVVTRYPEAVVRIITAAPDEVGGDDRPVGVVAKPPSAAELLELLSERRSR